MPIYTLTNANGLEAKIASHGGIVMALKTPDRAGRLADIVLGFDALEPYFAGTPYFGAIIGRYGNRIANGRFTLDGVTYTLAQNNGTNALHGGLKGFDKQEWQGEPFADETGSGLRLRYVSPDGEEGFPGTLSVEVVYRLGHDNALHIEYSAVTDKPTIVNLTNHSYFNLSGDRTRPVTDHVMRIDADRYTPVSDKLIPTGELREVDGTPFDFRTPRPIGARIDQADEQLGYGQGYDHNYVLNQSRPGEEIVAAKVVEPNSGRTLTVRTTEPGMQFYTGNYLNGKPPGQGTTFDRRCGFCLETQHFPDSPNQPDFPSTVLRPGETYRTRTIYGFGVED